MEKDIVDGLDNIIDNSSDRPEKKLRKGPSRAVREEKAPSNPYGILLYGQKRNERRGGRVSAAEAITRGRVDTRRAPVAVVLPLEIQVPSLTDYGVSPSKVWDVEAETLAWNDWSFVTRDAPTKENEASPGGPLSVSGL